LTSILGKNTPFRCVRDYSELLAQESQLDAIVVATPTKSHYPLVKAALEHGIHVFCEKPLTLSTEDSSDLVTLAKERCVVTQVGYHNRFVASFAEVKRLLEFGAIGRITHVRAEAYGPVVIRQQSATWRSRKDEGGGSLYDYAAHPLDLLSWYLGEPQSASGTVLGKIFSAETDDEVYSTLHYPGGVSAQLSVNWSDESYRKMATTMTLWGTKGRITADRQECQVYLRDPATVPPGYTAGWNTRYTTDLTEPVWFYLRGEEYSAELDYFVQSVLTAKSSGVLRSQNSFVSAAATDTAIDLILRDSRDGQRTGPRTKDLTPPVRDRRLRAFAKEISARLETRTIGRLKSLRSRA
jgi:predicted dehydrogenase